MSAFHLYLLGNFRLVQAEQQITQITSAKIQALLAHLAVESTRPHTREHLAELLWPDRSPNLARQNLRQALTRLQNALVPDSAAPPLLTITRQTVQVNPDSGLWCDFAEIEAVLAACRVHPHESLARCGRCCELLASGLQGYRGDLLADVDADSARFEEWALFKREWLRRETLHALHSLAEYHRARGDHEAAYAAAWRQVEIDPGAEAAHHQVMVSLQHLGRNSEALEQYGIMAQILQDEMEMEPGPESVALLGKIQSREKVSATGARLSNLYQLPRYFTPFLGRETELARLRELLADPNCHLVTLVGLGGMGKSRLAVQVAQEHSRAFVDGVYFVSLAGVNQPGPFLSGLAQALQMPVDLRAPTDAARQAQVLSFLGEKQILLILDNMEDLLPHMDPVVQILRRAPNVKIVATSRRPLNLQAEWLVDLEGLPVPDPQTANEANPDGADSGADSGAIALFQQHGRRVLPGFDVGPENLPHIARICRLLQGMPLAVELAAAMVRTASVEQIAGSIAENLDALATTMQDVPPQHRSLRAIFDDSWRRLSRREQTVFMRLTHFHGSFDLQASAEVAQTTARELRRLTQNSMLRKIDDNVFQLHEVLRQYGREQWEQWLDDLAEDGRATERRIHARHWDFVFRRLQELSSDLKHARMSPALAQFRVMLPDIRSAWAWAVAAKDLTRLDEAIDDLANFYELSSLFSEAMDLFTAAIDRLEIEEQADSEEVAPRLAHLRLALARFYNSQARVRETIDVVTRGMASAKRARVTRFASEFLSIWGFALIHMGEFEAARAKAAEALALAQAAKSPRDEALALRTLGIAAGKLGHAAEAQQLYERSLPLGEAAGDRVGTAKTLNNLGIEARRSGNFEQARFYYERAIAIWEAIGFRWAYSFTSANLALVYDQLGSYVRADALYSPLLGYFQRLGDGWGLGWILAHQSLLHHHLAQQETAAELARKALKSGTAFGLAQIRAYAWTHLGHALLELDQAREAEEAYSQALALYEELGQENMAPEPRAGLARMLLAQGKPNAALAQVEAILAGIASHELAGTNEPMRVYLTCYRTLRTMRDPRAAELLQTAQALLQRQAALIQDAGLRTSFLENVAAHGELLAAV